MFLLADPPHAADGLDLNPGKDGMNGLPELLLTTSSPEEHRVKANSSVMMGKTKICPLHAFLHISSQAMELEPTF